MCGMQKKRPLLLGHRGARASRSVLENTIASFDLAMAHSCDGFEFDVRRSGDGAAVICHDPVWRASADGGKPGVEIVGASTEELMGIATLEAVVERFAGGAFLDIELKVGGLETQVVAAIEAHAPRRGFVVSSFLPEVLLRVHGVAAKIPLGLICDTPKQMALWETLPVSAVIPQHKLVTRELVNTLHASQKHVLVWTVNDAGRMRELAEWGVDGLISDDTALLVKTFAGLATDSAHER
jgi:glycerophosphoryl diester phosphodiesterase